MGTELPEGYTWRRPTVDDASAFYDLVAARNTEIIGFADFTRADAADQLREPGWDPTTDGWLVHDRVGALVGFGWSFGHRGSDLVDIEIIEVEESIAHWLFDVVLARADEMAVASGHAGAQADLNVYRDDGGERARVQSLGFEPAATFHRMRIDHHGVPATPAIPDGVEVQPGTGDEAFLRLAHEVLNSSFAEHFGWVPKSLAEWRAVNEVSSVRDWSQLRLAFVAREPAAILCTTDAFVAYENCGYVSNLGVLSPFRGRGLARFLLHQAFADDARRGLEGTLLHVDTDNPTPALDLYLGMGMRTVLVVDVWRHPAAR